MDCHQRTWTAFVYRVDASGRHVWSTNVTDAAARCVSDAAEHIITARGGKSAVYVDSGTLGPQGTGGNFGLVLLAPETKRSDVSEASKSLTHENRDLV